MRRALTALLLLIQFCVQSAPLAFADDGASLPSEEPAVVLEEPFRAASGSMIPLETSSGTVIPQAPEILSESASGSIVSLSGAVTLMEAVEVAEDQNLTEVIDALPVLQSTPLHVVITEVMWMGSNLSTADEWVEIAAFSSGSLSLPQSLSGWTLVTVKAGVETTIARLKPEHRIASGDVIIVANYVASASRLAIEPTIVTTGMSLPNTQVLLRLKNASGAVIDEVDDGIGVPFAGANPSGGGPKASMERTNVWGMGNVASSWSTATLSTGFDDGPPIFGTPGSSALVPVQVQPPEPSPESPINPSMNVPIIPIQAPPLLRLTEVLPNPPGYDTDEWIEIGSFAETVVNLAEVTLRTGTTRFALDGALLPGEARAYGKVITGLSLPNTSGTLELLWRDRIIDTWTYGETLEGVSLGRGIDGTVTPQCVPSPNALTFGASLNPEIVIQSSNAGAGTLSLNLDTQVMEGSLAGASCTWAYPDGYTSSSCNPPSHSMPGPLQGDVILVLKDYCGNTLTRSLHIDLPGKNSGNMKDDTSRACLPTAFTGVVVSEVLPNPNGDEEEGEWIELSNPSTVEKPLCGWSIDDGKQGSDPYSLDRWRLPAGESLLLPRGETGIALNNDVDAVRLFAPQRVGGSATYEIVRYKGAPEGRSWSRRDDNVWLWSDTPTPGTENHFEDVQWPTAIEARISSALPNPAGDDDRGDEWVEIENLTRFSLPLTGWSVQTSSTTQSLNGIILLPFEQKQIEMPHLPNTKGFVRLRDRDAQTQSVLTWNSTKDDQKIVQPQVVADVSELTVGKSDDCIHWTVKDRDGHEIVFAMNGIKIEERVLCMNYVSTLLENKKVDQKIYSKDGVQQTLLLDGTDVVSLMLRSGIVIVDHDSHSLFLARYQLDEAEARGARRGVWADESTTQLIDASRALDVTRNIIQEDGLMIKPSLASGIIDHGVSVEFSTNVPAFLWVADGTGSYIPYHHPITIVHDTDLRIRAESEVQSSSGLSYTIESFQSYAVRKSRYPLLKISEVYPSPNSGEKEWVELWNPTSETVSLLGWSVDDALDTGSRPAVFSQNVSLAPGERRIFDDLSIAWNNTGDRVCLIDPNGQIRDDVSYGSVKKGRAVAVTFDRNGEPLGECTTVHATPGQSNRCAMEQKPAKKLSMKKRSGSKKARSHTVRYVNVEEQSESDHTPRDIFGIILNSRVSTEYSFYLLYVGLIVSFSVSLSIFCIVRLTRWLGVGLP